MAGRKGSGLKYPLVPGETERARRTRLERERHQTEQYKKAAKEHRQSKQFKQAKHESSFKSYWNNKKTEWKARPQIEWKARPSIWWEAPETKEVMRAKWREKRKIFKHYPAAAKSNLLEAARNRAKMKNIPYSLTVSGMDWPEVCPILGTELDYTTPPGLRDCISDENQPSIDQIIPGLGYVYGNVAVMSRRANTIKNVGNAEEHRAIADWLDKRLCW